MGFFSRNDDVRVYVKNKNVAIKAHVGANLYKFLKSKQVTQPSVCDGSGLCGRCRVRYFGDNIPKATNKECLVLAKTSIEAGYRLACQHTIRKDIEIDTSEMMSSSIFAAEDKKNDSGAAVVCSDNGEEKAGGQGEAIKSVEVSAAESKSDRGDNIFIVQEESGVRYFCYSGITHRIVQEGFEKTSESLKDVIDHGLVPDFIHNVLNIDNINRVLLLIDYPQDYASKNMRLALEMARTFSFSLGTMLCEVIMPYKERSDIVRFFRIIHSGRNRRLLFFLDMLDRVYFLTDSALTDVRSCNQVSNMFSITPACSNPITDFDNNLNYSSAINPDRKPNGIGMSALLKLLLLMSKRGMVDANFTIKPREELSKLGVPLEFLVRVIQERNVPVGFYAFRDRSTEIIVSQSELHELARVKNFILNAIRFVKDMAGGVGISSLLFYTNDNYENITNYMCDLGFIPKEYVERTAYVPGEALAYGTRLFDDSAIADFIAHHFTEVSVAVMQ